MAHGVRPFKRRTSHYKITQNVENWRVFLKLYCLKQHSYIWIKPIGIFLDVLWRPETAHALFHKYMRQMILVTTVWALGYVLNTYHLLLFLPFLFTRCIRLWDSNLATPSDQNNQHACIFVSQHTTISNILVLNQPQCHLSNCIGHATPFTILNHIHYFLRKFFLPEFVLPLSCCVDNFILFWFLASWLIPVYIPLSKATFISFLISTHHSWLNCKKTDKTHMTLEPLIKQFMSRYLCTKDGSISTHPQPLCSISNPPIWRVMCYELCTT